MCGFESRRNLVRANHLRAVQKYFVRILCTATKPGNAAVTALAWDSCALAVAGKEKTAPAGKRVRPIEKIRRRSRGANVVPYANALMREDRRESLRATVLRFMTPTRALR